MSAAATKTNGSSEGSGMRAASSICEPGPAPTEILIGAADELMACVGRLRTIEPGMETSPLARLLDRILDARTILMRARDGVLALAFVLALPADGASVRLAWNANPGTDNVTAYELEAKEVLGTGSKFATVSGDLTTLIVTGLSRTPHYFRLRARNSSGVSPWCGAIVAVPSQTVRVTLQRSTTLTGWQDVIEKRLPKQEREFFRVEVEVEP
jgi:hypothetical protein